ncbi:MAG: hypothetical protein R6U68_04470 [Desulfobacteraceae bacterium]
MEEELPLTVLGAVASFVHKYKKDTPSLLEHVYQARPMLKAAPGETLDFSLAVSPSPPQKKYSPKFNNLTARKQKNFKKR